MKQSKPQTIEAYIEAAPPASRGALRALLAVVRKAAPTAEECISYAMPAFRDDRILFHFAGYEKHIGFYPGAAAIAVFKKEIAAFKWAKGSVQFPLHHSLPVALIAKIVKFRVEENRAKAAAKKKSTPKKKAAESSHPGVVKPLIRSRKGAKTRR